jgi:type I restriction enzyme, S subunit
MGIDVPIEHDLSWPVFSLAEITSKIGSGATPRGGSDTYLPSRINFALVRSQNVFDRRFDCEGLAYISDDQADGLRSVILRPDDILLNITGDGITFGRACIVPIEVLPACVNQHVSIIRLDSERANPGYVLAFLTHPDVKQYIESFNAGGSRRAITKGHIESFRLPLPPLPEQRAIAHILGTLDNKIDLNRRMNETLEAMARAIFKDWFVDFGPTRAKMAGRAPYLAPEIWALFPDRLNDQETPVGWPVRPLRHFGDTGVGGYWGDDQPQGEEAVQFVCLPRRMLRPRLIRRHPSRATLTCEISTSCRWTWCGCRTVKHGQSRAAGLPKRS